MKNLIKLILGITCTMIVLTACVATKGQKERFLAKHCVGSDSSSVVAKDSIVEKHDTLKLSIPGPIQYLENPCKVLCDSLGRLKPFKISKKENGIKGSVFSVGNSIGFKCDFDSAKIAYAYTEHHSRKTTISKTVIQKPCDLEHRTKFDGFTYWWFWITASIYALYIIIKICKKYLKSYLPFLK